MKVSCVRGLTSNAGVPNTSPTLRSHYSGLYVRRTLSDDQQLSATSAVEALSPDVIIAGTTRIIEPQALFGTATSYSENFFDKSLVKGQENFIYVRAKNFGSVPESVRVYLYYAPAGLTLTPDQWKNNMIKTSSGAEYATLTALSDGAIAVSSEPFSFTPPNDFQDYSLITLLTPIDQQTPVSDSITSIDGYANWMATSRVAYRTIAHMSTGMSAGSFSFQLANPDGSGKNFMLSFVNSGLPSGVVVSVDEPGFAIPNTVLPGSGQTLNMNVTLDANFKSTLPLKVFPANVQIPKGARLSVRQYLAVTSDPGFSVTPPSPVLIGEATIVFD